MSKRKATRRSKKPSRTKKQPHAKRVEEPLNESEELYRSLFEITREGIIISDPDGRISSVNPAGMAILGYKKQEEIMGKSAADFYAKPEQRKAVFEELIEKGYVTNIEVVAKKADGTQVFVLANFSLHKDREGNILRADAFLTDITERKKIEQELENARRFATIGETTAMVGHDLRNPLQSTIFNIELAKAMCKSVSSPARKHKLRELLESIEKQMHYMDKIVSDLSDYARPLKPKFTETGLQGLIDTSLSEVEIPGNVKVSVKVEEKARLTVDSNMMKHVFVNVILNAVQAMPEGGRLTIRSSATEDAALISIQDTGVGIPEENLGSLFEPLLTTKAQGVGLGLPVCRRLVEAHNGTITVESKVGEGSTFTVKIPSRRRVS